MDLERVEKKIDVLNDRVSEMVATNRQLMSETKSVVEQVRKHDATLLGKNGLVIRMERQEVVSNIRSKLTWMIAGAIATGVASLVLWGLQSVVKAFGD